MVFETRKDALFSPLPLGDNLTLGNRLIHQSLDHRRAPYGVPSPLVSRFYSERADTSSLTISEPIGVNFTAVGSIFAPLIRSEEQIRAWENVINAVHEKSGFFFGNLNHSGRLVTESAIRRNHLHYSEHLKGLTAEKLGPFGPSDLKAEGYSCERCELYSQPKALSEDGIEGIVEDFRLSAENLKLAGADGVEIEAGNGQLLNQFLDPNANLREDEYGLKNENGFLFIRKVIASVKSVEGLSVGIHFSNISPTDLAQLDGEVDYIRVSVSEFFDFPLASTLVKSKLIVSGVGLDKAVEIVNSSSNVAVSFSDIFTSNPDLRQRIKNSWSITPYLESTIGQAHGLDNHVTATEYGEPLKPIPALSADLKSKKVAIIGAGASGISSARAFLKFPNYEVVIFERRNSAGGIWSSSESEKQAELRLPSNNAPLADPPAEIPKGEFPLKTKRVQNLRFSQSPIYPGLVTNVPQQMMFGFSAFKRDIASGDERFFITGQEVCSHVANISAQYEKYIRFNTSIEQIVDVGTSEEPKFEVISKKELSTGEDSWLKETFDNVIVAIGHNWVPRIPDIEGLASFNGHITHSANYRGPAEYAGKNVVVVGSRESGLDIMNQLRKSATKSVTISQHSTHPLGASTVEKKNVTVKSGLTALHGNTAHFSDSSVQENVDVIIFATGYHYSFPFLSNLRRTNSEGENVPYSSSSGHYIPGLYEHTFDIYHKGIAFVGPPVGTPSFSAWEKQAYIAALVFNGLAKLPPIELQEAWHEERIAVSNGSPHILLAPGDRVNFQENLNLIAAPYLARYERIDDELLRDWPSKWSGILFKALEEKKQQYSSD